MTCFWAQKSNHHGQSPSKFFRPACRRRCILLRGIPGFPDTLAPAKKARPGSRSSFIVNAVFAGGRINGLLGQAAFPGRDQLLVRLKFRPKHGCCLLSSRNTMQLVLRSMCFHRLAGSRYGDVASHISAWDTGSLPPSPFRTYSSSP